MTDEASAVPHDAVLDCDLCIVGAGAAGVSVALGLIKTGLKILLIEAGGAKQTAQSQAFYDGQAVNPAHAGPHMYRQRRLGGSTTIWGGRCVPFDPVDFERRDHVPLSGWPFGRPELDPFYEGAQAVLEAGAFDYSAASALSGPDFVDGFADRDFTTDQIERYSPPTDVWKHHGQTLAAAGNVRTISGAACIGLDRDAAGTGVALARFAAEDRRFGVKARAYVVATGGLEVARLLLASDIGNHADMVGRTYMCHVEGAIGSLHLTPADRPVRYGFEKTKDGVYARRRLMMRPERQAELGVMNAMVRLHHPNVVDPSHGNGVLSAMFVAKSFIIPEFRRKLSMVEHAASGELKQDARFWMRHAANIVGGAFGVAGFLFNWATQHTLPYRKLPYVALRSRAGVYPLDFNGEQSPNLDSRVILSDERDPYGMPRLKIDWRISDLDVRTLVATLRDLRDAFARSGCGKIVFDDAKLEEHARSALPVGGHHIGTARMSVDPSHGVVDADCRVHHVDNLYISSAATFPTSSHANPTLTIVAMALRLAQHLERKLT